MNSFQLGLTVSDQNHQLEEEVIRIRTHLTRIRTHLTRILLIPILHTEVPQVHITMLLVLMITKLVKPLTIKIIKVPTEEKQ